MMLEDNIDKLEKLPAHQDVSQPLCEFTLQQCLHTVVVCVWTLCCLNPAHIIRALTTVKKQAEDLMRTHDDLAEVKSEHTSGKVLRRELPI